MNTGEPIEPEGLVEFRLLYQGSLYASANDNPRAEHKHAIRRFLHPQLRRQWEVHAGLQQVAERHGVPDVVESPENTKERRIRDGLIAIGKQWSRNNFSFVPLVTQESSVRCSIDVMLLRPEEDRFIMQRGDIDGQVKTVFDALSIPTSSKQTEGKDPGEDETPFFCLLSDDRLISELRVSSEQLLLLPGERTVKATDAFVVIHVRINAKYPGAIGNYLE